MVYVFPNELDDAQRLLTLVGSFWAETYQDNDLVASLLHARAQLSAQAHLDLLDLVAAMSRFKVPIFHRDNWTVVTLLESEVNRTNLAKFNGVYTFSSGLQFDVPPDTTFFVWALENPPERVQAILNGITDQTVTYALGVDFFLEDGQLWLRSNPFEDANISVDEVFKDGAVIDRQCTLWLYRGEWEWQTTFEQFGYAVDIKLKSSRNYRDLVNAVYDGLVEGTSARCIDDFMSAACDVPLAKGTETVRYVLNDRNYQWIITDDNVYRYKKSCTPLVTVGDTVEAGEALVDTLQIFEFNRGVCPDDIRAIAVCHGLLASGYFQDLVFENKVVPLIVDTTGEYTRVSFEVGGLVTDVEKFFDDLHASGVAAEQTLAMLMDTRPEAAKDTKPGPLALPATINPLSFLIANVFRDNLHVIKVKPSGFGPDALGLTNARHLRKLIPPHTAAVLLVELEATGDEVIMDGPGDETNPGYEESITTFQGNVIVEDIDVTMVEERVRVIIVGGQCH